MKASTTAVPAAPELVLKTEIMISRVLRGGVLLSIAIVGLGIADFFSLQLAGRLPAMTFPDSLGSLLAGLQLAQPLAIASLGLLVLMATPVLRVAISIPAFALERDWTYVRITTLVLAILLFSIFAVGDWMSRPGIVPVHGANLFFFFAVLGSSLFAGFIGALVGLGGGVFVVPILTLVFHVPFDAAIGASIVSVIATSSGAAAAYVKDRLTNLRVGMFLEVATTAGAICGALLSTVLDPTVLFIVFGAVLVISALPLMLRMGEELPQNVRHHPWAQALRLGGSYPDRRLKREVAYTVDRVPHGFGIMWLAGALSGLLGIGSGTFKVLALDTAMRLPMKVSTTTSNFMIGVTAAASAGIFFQRGDIDPVIAAPVALGVLAGATLGALSLSRMSNRRLRILFVPIVLLVAANMLARGFGLI